MLTQNPSHRDIEEWLCNIAIPVLNRCDQKNTPYEEKQAQYDAIRLMILIIGDSCPTKHKASFYSDKKYFDFMASCFALRCHLSHKIHIVNKYDDIKQLLALGKKIRQNH